MNSCRTCLAVSAFLFAPTKILLSLDLSPHKADIVHYWRSSKIFPIVDVGLHSVELQYSIGLDPIQPTDNLILYSLFPGTALILIPKR